MCCSVRNVGKWSRDQTSSLDWVMITLENNQDGSRRISSQTPDTRNYQENVDNTSEFGFDDLRPVVCQKKWQDAGQGPLYVRVGVSASV